jgi:CDP-glycerol glycerophosphotransferase
MSEAIENRLAALEQAVARIDAFDQAATAAVRQIADQIKSMTSVLATMRTVDALSRASHFYPKTRRVAFVGHSYFGDNVKYAFLAFSEFARRHSIDCSFVTDDPHQYELLMKMGLSCFPSRAAAWTADDVRALLATAVVVLGDNFHAYRMESPRAYGLLQGAKTVQLWHGIPIKQIGLGYVMRGDNTMMDDLIASSGPYEVLVAPGLAMRDEWRQQFSFRDFAATGYPRNDVFFREPTESDLLNVDLKTYDLFRAAKHEGKTTLLYTPTYRDGAGLNWFEDIGIPQLVQHCRNKGYFLAINLHPYEQNRIAEWRARHSDAYFIALGTDIYPIVKHADILITDYSSLMFDYLLLDRPVVFYRADECITKQRGFIEGRINMTPGMVTNNLDQLLPAVDAAAMAARDPKNDPSRAQRKKLCAELYDHRDGKAAERLCGVIEKLLPG